MLTVLTPSHLAGRVATPTALPDGSTMLVLTPGAIAVAPDYVHTRDLTAAQLATFRRALGPCPEPPDVEDAIDAIDRTADSPVVQVRMSPASHQALVDAAGGKAALPGLLRRLAREYLRRREP